MTADEQALVDGLVEDSRRFNMARVNAEAALAEALSLLRKTQWSFDSTDEDGPLHCSVCGERSKTGHASDCRLAAFLARHLEGSR